MPAVAHIKKTVWHSQLREMGPVTVQFTHKPRPSKFPGKPEYCRFVLDGIEHDYQCETPAISEQLQAVPLGQPLRIHALGSKEAAHLEVERAANLPPAGSSTEAPTTVARATQQNRVQAPAPAPVAPTCSRGYWDALDVAVELVARFKAKHGREPSEAERAIATTLFIELNRSGKPLTRGAQ